MIPGSLLLLALFFIIVPNQHTNGQTLYGCNAPTSEPCSLHHLTCGDGEVIAFEYEELNHPITLVGKLSVSGCPLPDNDVCAAACCTNLTTETSTGYVLPPGIAIQTTPEYDYYDGGDVDTGEVNMSDIVSIYNECSNRQSCTINSPQGRSSNERFEFVKYNYICIQESRVYSILEKRRFRKRNMVYLYLSGRGDNPPEARGSLTCTCQIQSDEEITLYSTYINLHRDSCRKIRISSTDRNLFNCSDDGVRIFYEILLYSKEPIFIDLSQLSLIPEDFLWVEFYANNDFIDVSCSGCGDIGNDGMSSGSIRYLTNWVIVCFNFLISFNLS